MTDWTPEEDEAFNEVEKQSNLGKRILKEIRPERTWVGLDEDEFVYFCAYVNHEILLEIENVLKAKNEQQTQ